MTALSVNLNKIALIRNSRLHNSPDLMEFSEMAIDVGVQGLTVHPRPDQRHIRQSDVLPLARLCQKRGCEYNIEGNPFSESLDGQSSFLSLVYEALPTQCTLVPDSRDQLTSNHGWQLLQGDTVAQLKPVVEALQRRGIRVSLFLDPDINQMSGVVELGVDRIELYTEPYARAFEMGDEACINRCLVDYQSVVAACMNFDIGVNAGHDLTAENLPLFLSTCRNILEVSIGHGLTVDALKEGFSATVARYLTICQSE